MKFPISIPFLIICSNQNQCRLASSAFMLHLHVHIQFIVQYSRLLQYQSNYIQACHRYLSVNYTERSKLISLRSHNMCPCIKHTYAELVTCLWHFQNFANSLISHLCGYQLKMKRHHSIFRYRATKSHNNSLQFLSENNDWGNRDDVRADVSCVMVYGISIFASITNKSIGSQTAVTKLQCTWTPKWIFNIILRSIVYSMQNYYSILLSLGIQMWAQN